LYVLICVKYLVVLNLLPGIKLKQSKIRREEEIENFKKAVLDTAIFLMREEKDWGMVSVNKIASIIRYTPPNIYHYFENKDDILFHLGVRGSQILGAKLKSVANKSYSDPHEKLFHVGLQFWDFSIKNEELYDLMFHVRQKKMDLNLVLNNIKTIQGVIKEVNPKIQTELDAYKVFQGFHCLIHGFISIKMNNRIPISDHVYFKQLFEDSLKKFIEQI